MFKLETIHPQTLAAAIDAMSSVIVDGLMQFTPSKGLVLQQTDSGGCVHVSFQAPPESFCTFEAYGSCEFGLNLPSFHKVLRTLRGARRLELTFEGGVDSRLKVVGTLPTRTVTHSVNTLDCAVQQQIFRHPPYPTMCVVNSKVWYRTVQDLRSLSSGVKLTPSTQNLTLDAKGPFSTQQTVLSAATPEKYSSAVDIEMRKCGNQSAGLFHLNTLSLFARAGLTAPQTNISFTDSLLNCTYTTMNGVVVCLSMLPITIN